MKKNKIITLIFCIMIPAVFVSAQVNAEKFRKDLGQRDLLIKCGLSLAIYKGNSDIFQLSSDLGIDYKTGKHYFFLRGNLTYGEKSKESYINKAFIHLRGVRNLNKHLMAELFVQGEYNEFILLDRRRLLGAGVGFQLVNQSKEKKNLDIVVGLGLMHETEKFKESADRLKKEDTSLFKSSNYLSFKFDIKEKLNLTNVTYLQINLGNEKSTRVTNDLDLEITLSKLFSYTAKLNYRYDNNPAPSIKNYDIQITNGITFKLVH